MKYFFIIVLGVVLVGGLLFLSLLQVAEKEFVVLTQFGKPSRTIVTSGPHFKRPGFLETVNRIDRRINIFSTQPIQLMLGDKNPIVLTCYVCWRVSKPLLFFQSLVNSAIAIQKLGDMINSQLGNVLGNFILTDIINTDSDKVKISVIEEQILKNANARTVEKYGIEVVQIGMRKISYPVIVTKAVYNRMRSEREKEAMKYRAEGMEAAAKIKAKADREVSDILARAYKQSQILKGEGDRKALKIYSKAYSENLDFYEFTKSMEVYKDILKKDTTFISSTDSDLFRYLNNPEGTKE